MSRNKKRSNFRRKRRFTRRKRQAPLHIPSVQIQPWRRLTLVLETTGIAKYEAFAVKNVLLSLAKQTTLIVDKDHPYLIKFSRVRVWNQGQSSTLGPLGLMPLSLINATKAQEPLITFEDHPVGINPARAQYTWPRLHQQAIFHSVIDEDKFVFAAHSKAGDKLIIHLVVAYKPLQSADFVAHVGPALTMSLRDMELL